MFNDYYDLIFALFNEIGLAINQSGQVYDRDTKTPLYYNEKPIKASVDRNSPLYPTEYYQLFDLDDPRFMNFILGYYLEKESAMNDLNAITYWNDEPNGRTAESACFVKTGSGTFNSKYYFNKALKFSDIILRIGGYDFDLFKFDNEWVKANATKSKSR